jgi:[pyruvate, water dikinase]-phosphate phosphotransferase / [pyruvate, water dikinase] kinase
MQNKLKIIIISDGTGETATSVARSAMTQFEEKDVYFTRYKNVRSKEQLDAIFNEAAIHHDMIVYTVVSEELRKYIVSISKKMHVRSVDIMGPILETFSNYFESEPSNLPGLYHAVNDDYFKRVAAIEFTLNHDDGKNLNSLETCDVVLVGISRTSKTPLSIYLSMEGLKVVNVPIILDMPLADKILEIDQRKIFCLTIDPEALYAIRKNRLTRLGVGDTEGDYAEFSKVSEEIEYAQNIFNRNKRWPVFNVTDKALEETAAEITKLLNMRKVNRFKQSKRLKKIDDTN